MPRNRKVPISFFSAFNVGIMLFSTRLPILNDTLTQSIIDHSTRHRRSIRHQQARKSKQGLKEMHLARYMEIKTLGPFERRYVEV